MVWSSGVVLLGLLAVVITQRQAPLPRNRNGQNGDADADADVINGDEIPGIAGIDYPVLSEAPITDFTCDLLKVPGYYADQQAGCQVYYRCHKSGRGVATLCPNGTVFNQETLVCDWWYNVDCSRAVEAYKVNEEIIQEMAAIDASNPNAPRVPLSRVPSLAALAGRVPSLAALTGRAPSLAALTGRVPSLAALALSSRLRNPVTVSPFDRRLGAQSPSGRGNSFDSPARFSQDRARDSENSPSDGNGASQRYDSAKGKGDKNNDYKNDKEFDGYNYPNPNGIDRSYLPPSK